MFWEGEAAGIVVITLRVMTAEVGDVPLPAAPQPARDITRSVMTTIALFWEGKVAGIVVITLRVMTAEVGDVPLPSEQQTAGDITRSVMTTIPTSRPA